MSSVSACADASVSFLLSRGGMRDLPAPAVVACCSLLTFCVADALLACTWTLVDAPWCSHCITLGGTDGFMQA